MADDPNRDILPVKDDSCYGSVRCFSEIDPRERHIVCKLDRYQLEDRYLRLLEEVQSLKKSSNSQEDKIRRLTTKLMRSAASSRTCSAVLTINEEREKITRLELENARLKDTVYALKNQLLSHRGPRSPLRCRRSVTSGISSGPTTCRSESARAKYQSQPREAADNNDVQNYPVRIEELETQRNEMMARITELENQLAANVAGIQRVKVQDNVEYIRMWRQMKQANDKLISVQATNDTLHSQIGDLKKLLEETTKNNKEITAALASEKQRLSEIDDQITNAKGSQLSLREKDEQIRDLTNEMKILQQHNNELIALSSKFGQVETENIELKRKLSEYLSDNQNLKSALDSGQADRAVLRATNDKMIEKIEELQRNMDNLTLELMTFQNRKKIRYASKGTQSKEIKNLDKNIGTSDVSSFRSILPEEERNSLSDKSVDQRKPKFTEEKESGLAKTKESATEVEQCSNGCRNVQTSIENPRNSTSSKPKLVQHAASPSMSREKILMLLDQVQISTPLEAQNAARMRQIDVVAVGQNDIASIYPESHRIPITTLQRRSNDAFTFTNISALPGGNDDNETHESAKFIDPKEILSTLFEILKRYSEKIYERPDKSSLCNDGESSSTKHITDRNDGKNLRNQFERNNWMNKNCPMFSEKMKMKIGIDDTKTVNFGKSNKEPLDLLHKFTETDQCCRCGSNRRCFSASDYDYGCCAPETAYDFILPHSSNVQNNAATVESKIAEIGSNIQKVFAPVAMGRDFKSGSTTECYGNCHGVEASTGSNQSKIDNSSKVISNCDSDCPTANECGDTPASYEISTLPLLITKEQGLVEIHILALQLSAKAMRTLFNDNSNDISVFVSWDIWDQETAFTQILKYPALTFNSSSVYRVCDLENFFESVLSEHIVFQVHVINADEETFTIAKAKLSVKDILDYPQNKLHYITPVLSVMPCTSGGNFGQLSLWIRLSCDIDLVENFKDRCRLSTTHAEYQQSQIPAHRTKQEPGSSSFVRTDFPPAELLLDSSNFSSPVRDLLQDVPEQQKNLSGNPLKTKGNRLDTICESAEPETHLTESDEESDERKKRTYRYEDSDEKWSDTNIERKVSLTMSNLTHDNDSGNSDTRIDEPTEKRTSQDLHLDVLLQKKRDSGHQVESGSITEFNDVLKNQTYGSSIHETESTIKDLGTVIADDKWNDYKRNSERSSIGFPLKSENSNIDNIDNKFPNKSFPPAKDTITISIVSMNLFDKTSIMNNPEVDLLYIEYSFLGIRGVDMETVSLPKPRNKGQTMVYNFTRKFQIDEEYHNSQRSMLNAMLSGNANPVIRFVIVSEPLPEEMDTKECIEVGHADFNIREYALGDGLRVVPLIIMDPSQSEQCGMLKITVDGIEIIRKCIMVQKRL